MMKFENDFNAESAGATASSLAQGQSFHALLLDGSSPSTLRECK